MALSVVGERVRATGPNPSGEQTVNELLAIVRADECAPLVIRTDYTDDAAWREVVAELDRVVGDEGRSEPPAHLVDDRRWAGACEATGLRRPVPARYPRVVQAREGASCRCEAPQAPAAEADRVAR
ncbi:DUF6924 domain-containing protein [Streptomyces sp. NPDC048142]|uniref:DUF6924 domain-containing protein n=1 Tax=Streptomyces sp. NPDC048142 TaxID=3365501 RepID=UPI00371CBB61